MGQTQRLWLLASLCQVVLLTCEKHSNTVEVEVLFQPLSQDPDSYKVTCRPASNHLVYVKSFNNSACSHHCRILLRMAEDQKGYNITLRASRSDAVLETKTFHFLPVSTSSFNVYSTTTTALLTWKLHRLQTLSSISLYNTRTETVVHSFNINSSEVKSQYTMKGLQPGTRFKAKVTVTTYLKQFNITLKQRLRILLETAQCPPGWMAIGGSCYIVRRTGLTWSNAQHRCSDLAAGSHLANLKSLEDLVFISSYLLSQNNLLLLWTGLNDQQEEGRPLWSDGSSYNQTNTMKTLLPANQTDCFAFQRNATGPGFFLTPFFCNIPLPFICQYQTPLVPASFSFDLVQVTEDLVELRWSDLSLCNSPAHSSFEVFLQYQEEEYGEWDPSEEERQRKQMGTKNQSTPKKIVRVPISISSRGVTLAGLSPGSIYSFTLQASHPPGFAWSLGQTQIAYTRPHPAQNITVGPVTASHISVHWMLPEASSVAGWTFVVRYEDMSSKQDGVVGMANISKSSGLRSYTAVIGGLESHRKYRIEVYTVTQHGIGSCGQATLTVKTAVKAVSGLVVISTRSRNLTVCGTHPPRDPPDGYFITSQPLDNPTAPLLWLNHSTSDGHLINGSMCFNLGTFTPGQTYEVGVVALKGNDRSERSSVIHTTAPMPVQVAVPVSVGTNYAQLYIQHPQLGVMDGVKVCACPGDWDTVCKGLGNYLCDWYSLAAHVHLINLSNLSPGSPYQLRVYSTSREQLGPPYYSRLFRTSLAPPSRVREGQVTDTSIELLWDPAPGQDHSYEAICLNCESSQKVQKVLSHSAVFSGLTPGSLYRFEVRTEKQSFTDSSPVTINITAAPSPVEVSLVNKTTSSICISWSMLRGLVTTLILSIKNRTSTQELITSYQEPRLFCFKCLASGSQYTVEVITISGDRRSKPTTMTLCTIPEVPQEVTLSENAVTSVSVTWRPPPGQVMQYKLLFGLLSVDRKSWTEVRVQGTSCEVKDLIPGSDYGVSIQSVLGSDSSQAVHKGFSTRPAGLHHLYLDHLTSSSASVSWDSAHGAFDFHRVNVTNTLVTTTLTIPKEKQVAVVTGLLGGCSYNVTVERVKGVTAGRSAFLSVTTVPAPVQGLHITNISACAFSLRWEQAVGCVDHYQVNLLPNQGNITMHPARDGYIQADVVNVSPKTQYTVTVTAASSSNISPGVSRMINRNGSVPGPPLGLEGEAVGSNGILLSWNIPSKAQDIDGYVIRYKEVCPYPDPAFTQVTKYLDIPETLITDFTSGSTYHIQVAAIAPFGVGAFSKPLYIKTAESPPGLVTNLTAYAYNHTFVVLTWFLPHRINGLITKFAVKARLVRTGQMVRMLEVNAVDIMTVALPHCNDAADILSSATLSPLEITASSPPITLSAVPPAASWNVPISVGVDQLRPYIAYLFEVSAFTSEGEGQVASTMVRMPESAPEDPPQNFSVFSMTSRSFSVSWSPPSITTGKFSYVLYLYGPTGFMYENSTGDMRFAFTGLKPYTRYIVAVRAKAAGEVGPAAEGDIVTPAEAPSAVQHLMAIAEDSVSIRVSWKSPAQPNGPIVQYRLLVLVEETLLQDITLTANTTGFYENETRPPDVHNSLKRHKRTAELGLITSPPTFTATISDRTLHTSTTASSFTHSGLRSTDYITNTNAQPTTDPMATNRPSPDYDTASRSDNPNMQSSDSAVSGTSALSLTSVPSVTLPPWLTKQLHAGEVTSDSAPLALTPGQLRLSTLDASITEHFSTRSGAVSGTTGVTVRQEVMDVLSEELSYLVSDLAPFTEYTFRVTASTTVGEGPAADITEKTREQVPSSVLEVSYQNISSTSILVSWTPPINPNGRITHYTVYGLKLPSNQGLKWVTNTTSILITDLDKYTPYKLRVAASTVVGESSLSEEDDIFVFTLEDEPDSPPVNLTVVNTTPSTVTIAWSAPEKANGVIQQYEVLYENESYSALVNTSSNKVTLFSLKPFSFYNVSVRAYTRYGNGNQTSDTLYLLSGEDVPGSPPYGLSYESVSPSEVNVTWMPPLLPNGVIIHYSLEIWNSSHYLNLTSPTNYIHITHLRKYAHYRIVVQAHTRVGPGNYSSEPLNVTTLEDVPSDSVQNLTAQIFSSTVIIVSWDPPLEPNGRPYYLLTLQEGGIIPDISNQGTPAVNKTINHTTNDSIFLFTKLRKYFPYVLTVTPATTAGPAYNHTSTMYLRTDEDIPSSAPLLVSTRNLSSSSIGVVWQRPLEANGEITEYTLILVGPEGTNTTHTPNTSFVLANLLPYTAYNLTITAATRKGSGPSLLLQLHSDESGPTSPPHNLTIFNHTAVSVWLSWEPPLEPNGVVIKYGFRIQDLITQTVTHRNSSGSSTTEYLSGFKPHSSYEISVYSFTRVGHGNQFSSPVSFTTNESVSDAVGNLSCSGVSWDSILLSWETPANPNGQIIFYEIQVEVDQQSYTHEAHTPEYTVTGLSPDQEYALSVAAVNSAGPGDRLNCTASTLSESVPAAPRFLTISQVTPNNVTLQWAPPHSVPGLLKEYHIIAQLISANCEPSISVKAYSTPKDDLAPHCIEHNVTVSINASDAEQEQSFTIHPVAKYRYYRFKVAAVTNAGVGDYTQWKYERTMAGNPDAPPRDLKVTSTSNSFHIAWDAPAVLSGPTSYLVQVDGPGVNISIVRAPGELMTVVVTNLTAFSRYSVTITAFTGDLDHASSDGKAIGPIYFQTKEEEPKDPPKNVTVSVIPEEVRAVKLTFNPPEEPNGNITEYIVYIYEKDQLVRNISLNIIQKENNTMDAVIEGLKGGRTYSLQISAKNGAGKSPLSSRVLITTGIKAPSKPTQKPQAMLSYGGVAMVTDRSITIHKPVCFYSDDNGPIANIQVIVAESGVKDNKNVTNWKSAYYNHPAPYFTDSGFSNPSCNDSSMNAHLRGVFRGGWSQRYNQTAADIYVIGESNNCTGNNTENFCNGPLKPNSVYVFKFRATNINGEYTDSEYSEHIRTAPGNGLLTRQEQIILGVLLSFFLAVLLIIIICGSVKIHQRKKEGGTYSPREAEIIETKCKLDQLIAVADMELKQEKLNQYSSFFFRRKEIYVIQLLSYRKSLKPVNKKSFLQHVEDLCANDNSKFQEEFSELPKLLQDLATTDADLPWNKSKNRFPNIKPYNNNRVKLLSEPGTAGSDYINASFVSGYLCPNEFIATQGPLPGTVADFWRMIWETGTHTIAMLTQCYEKGRIRCHKYWPEDNKPMSVFSDILISKVSEEVFPDWTIRTLKVEKHGHYILVRHFNYTSWPEHGVPESCSTLIKFVKAVRMHRQDNSTIVVHCSAGVGRTGVFIALDHLIQHVRDHDFVDIYGLVAELRSERMCMVQNLAQYIFLHQSTLELLNNKGNSQSIWFVSYSALEKMDSLDAMEGDVELEWEETTM
ncbi:phosphatidylinositol phosphatase PTPRQ isoform X5 [Oreochromis niloticus]|uniref:phosphatidylinositol phosphatase PTPRQ isoform X5 n=1 Tax=Oreochromis niloticus TaxID=8128 RepID=UPI0009052B55|nr:phosphatidylinositol phosphatase PTPRQ isoform X5 [Oreochromis niloticus]